VEKKNHFRFDSEEPELPETLPEETAEEPMQEDEDEDEDSDDDDAPEAIDNSAQLLKMKEQAKKREAANQLYVLITYFVSNKTCLQCL
jgi:U3 small nucleolar RNA-associated protein 16